MRKKGKLYTANKYNQTLFARDVDREKQNIFDGLGSSNLVTSGYTSTAPLNLSNVSSTPLSGISNTTSSIPTQSVIGNNSSIEWKPINKTASDFGITQNSSSTQSSDNKSQGAGWGQYASAGIAAVDAIGAKMDKKYKRGLWDAIDPAYHLAEDNHSKGGDAVSDAGVATTKAGLQMGNGWVALAGAALKVIGDVWNAGWGYAENKETIAQVDNANKKRDYLGNIISQANANEDILNYAAEADNALTISDKGFGNGWFTNKGTESLNNTRNSQDNAMKRFGTALLSSARNVDKMNDENVMKNFAAYGGPIDMPNTGGAAIDYGFMNDYITAKNRATDVKDKMSSNPFGAVNNPTVFALGGDVQSNGADFTTGLIYINAGGSHEENPYDGVQVGISKENGQPNLVEEGETIFDDYVYSKRIMIDNEAKKKFRIGKKKEISYADLSKKLEKEAAERPNDAISQRGLEKQMHDLADQQERQKAEMHQKEMITAFEQMSPEEQTMVMQQLSNAEGSTMEQSPVEEQPGMEQMTMEPTEEAVNAEAMPVGDTTGEVADNINAEGGNLYPDGGSMKEKIYKALGLSLDSEFNEWAKDNSVGGVDWETALENQQLIAALKKSNPALADAISRGYDFGNYQPSNDNTLTFDFTHGGWGKEDYDAWDGSTDAAWKEAVEKGLVQKGMKSKEIGEALSQTDAYKKGSDWLKASDTNRLKYLQSILNSADAPEAAKKYAGKYVDANGWLKDAATDYKTIFEDPNGTGVRNTHPGTYWKTPDEMLRGAKATNYFINEDGSVEEIVGDVPKDWVSAGNYAWADKNNDNTVNYYKKAVAPAADATGTGANGESAKTEEGEEYEPIHRSTWGRTASLLGPAVGLGMMAAGVGKPDYSRLDAAVNQGSYTPMLATWRPIGNYMKYNPFDILSQQNRNDANARATDRALVNNNGTLGTKMAGLIANGYNSQLADAELAKKAQEYNNTLDQQVQTFNRGTDIQNATSYNQNSATNAGIINAANQQRTNLLLNAAQQRMAGDAGWYNSLYGNVNNLFKGLGQWGKENEQYNMIAAMAANGLFGNVVPGTPIGDMYMKKSKGNV